MKNLIYILLVSVILVACDGFDLADNGLDNLQDLPEYVAFDADGVNASRSDNAVCEGDAECEDDLLGVGDILYVVVEAPAGTLDDINVAYTFSGDAVFGVDFNVAGASASGGTVTVEHNINQNGTAITGGVAFTDRGAIPVQILTDGVVDGDKTLTITLASASRGSETIAVGRGGTDLLTVATINIADAD